jgi:nicotinate phosphoribosyltransferase
VAEISPALLTDHYELTMVNASLRDRTSGRDCVFEVFARRLPTGRRYGVVAGTGRLIDLIREFRFDPDDIEFLQDAGVVDEATAKWLADYEFTGDVAGYPEGELFFPGSPILTISGGFAECVVLETLILSVLNYDCAIAAAAARMVTAARGRPIIEMGSRRAHERAAVAAARAAYRAGFAYTTMSRRRSNPRSRRSARQPPCWSTPMTSPRASATPSRSPARRSGPSGSTPATCRCWPPSPASC